MEDQYFRGKDLDTVRWPCVSKGCVAEAVKSERWPGQIMDEILRIIGRTSDFILSEMESRRVTVANS